MSVGQLLRANEIRRPIRLPGYFFFFRHSHGGTGLDSAHNPFLPCRASCSSFSNFLFPGAYFRSHRQYPSLTNLKLTLVPCRRSISAIFRPFLSGP